MVRWIVWAIAGLFLALTLALAFFTQAPGERLIANILEKQLSHSMKQKVHIGSLETNLFTRLQISNLHIQPDHEVDESDSLAKSGMRVVDRLAPHQMLGDNSIVVHAVHVDAGEIARLAESRTWVTHQPRSNMNNGVGLPETEAMLRMGVRVGLGNDGFSNAMWQEWKAAYLSHKLWHRDPRRMQGDTLVRMAIEHNAGLAGHAISAARC